MLARSGTNVYSLSDREEVHAKFGTPKASGRSEEDIFEEYYTRRKISDPVLASAYGMAFGMTLGLSEPFYLSGEVYRLAQTVIVGHDVRFIYDAKGEVLEVKCEAGSPDLAEKQQTQRWSGCTTPIGG